MLVAIMKCFLKYKKILMQLLYHEGQLIIVLFHFLTGRDIDTPETSTMQAASTSMFAHGRFISTSFGLPLSGFIMSPGLLVNYNFVTLVCAIVYARIKPMTSLVARPSPFFSVRFWIQA